MRPDEHKAKESRRYQARKKNQGDASAAQIAERRRQAAKARDNGNSIAAIRRRNGELPSLQQQRESAEAVAKARSSKFSKRKIVSNRDRYKEISVQEQLEQDAELGIDRETTDLVSMLEKTDDTVSGSTYFKFKDEQEELPKQDRSLFQIDFDAFEGVLSQGDCRAILDLSEEDVDLIDAAFDQQPMMPPKPLVPAFVKTSSGTVLFSKQQVIPEKKEQEDGIYVRNDPSKRTAAAAPKPAMTTTKANDDDGLDELLAMTEKGKDKENKSSSPSAMHEATLSSSSSRISLPRPGSIPKNLPRPSKGNTKATQKPASKVADEDEAWLDDMLG
ncbi:hypothetical protein LRAMOSA02053 [Lichtheimia ramosa]|uniref:Uncharacterized protein n=1 Tax=Lichtheimia ramosa TaxID=688394 RepID=A0A077WM21_9FUNG|nr:hypothetical protein LRAMOSA02053 [Lichtheimia ramosa]